MKIYVLADMEGISGIRKMEQVKRDNPAEYSVGCKLMTQEINEVIDALFEFGATEVVVNDTHGGGGQIDVADMDARAVYDIPNTNIMPSLDDTFDGLILLGHHAKAGTLNGFLDHTMSSESWFKFSINGVEMGEIGFEAAYAGHYGVPVIMVSGDEETIKEAKATLSIVEGAVVKWGIGRNRAKCLSLPEAYKKLRESIKNSMRLVGRLEPFKPEVPAIAELTLYRSDYADRYMRRTDIERVDARTIRKTLKSMNELPTFLL